MSENNAETKTIQEKPYHPIFPGMEVEKPEANLYFINVGVVVAVLIVAFFLLKKFIYTPDIDRRHGK